MAQARARAAPGSSEEGGETSRARGWTRQGGHLRDPGGGGRGRGSRSSELGSWGSSCPPHPPPGPAALDPRPPRVMPPPFANHRLGRGRSETRRRGGASGPAGSPPPAGGWSPGLRGRHSRPELCPGRWRRPGDTRAQRCPRLTPGVLGTGWAPGQTGQVSRQPWPRLPPPAGSLLLPQSGRATQGPRGWRGQPEPTPPRLKGTWKPGGPRAGRGAGEAGATWGCRCHNQRALLRGSHRRLQRALGSQGLQHRPQPLPCHPQGPASALGRPPPRRHAQVLPGHSPGGQNVTGQRLGPWPDPTQGAAPPPSPGQPLQGRDCSCRLASQA